MGGSGCAVAVDGGSVTQNPALLGIENDRWQGIEAQYHQSPVDDYTVQSLFSVTDQEKVLHNLGISVHLNTLIEEEVLYAVDFSGSTNVFRWSDNEYVLGIGAGYCFGAEGPVAHSLGGTLKYFRRAIEIEPVGTFYTGAAFSFDLGYILRLFKRLHVGVALRNTGPEIEWVEDGLPHEFVPQPTQLPWGIGYTDGLTWNNIRTLDYSLEISQKVFLRKEHRELYTNAFRAGAEFVFFRTMAIRAGYKKEASKRQEFETLSMGFGLSVLNHLEFDMFFSRNNNEYKIDDPRFGFAVTLKRALEWEKWDRKWWLVRGSDSH